jgi:hypothetical protein
MERKILRRFSQFDFVNVDGFPAVSGQNFLGFGFFLGDRTRTQISKPCASESLSNPRARSRCNSRRTPSIAATPTRRLQQARPDREDADGERA